MCEVYKIFSKDWKHLLDFSDQAVVDMFNAESFGLYLNSNNGYGQGKKWLNVQVTMWKEDISKGLFRISELYDDPKFPRWWLDSVFKKDYYETSRNHNKLL